MAGLEACENATGKTCIILPHSPFAPSPNKKSALGGGALILVLLLNHLLGGVKRDDEFGLKSVHNLAARWTGLNVSRKGQKWLITLF